MKNLKTIERKELKTINGNGAPQCPAGYKPCITGMLDEMPKWSCIPSNLVCNP
ncbi:hypothetical protein M2347_003306 [Chryseobacterium sp. H1D6B]|uniref:bacteriocin-like protein n=1 Tax=Chryseobacterium sp. H1D6B TaxID=2940588 RepID=UPI0015C94D23|nr:hypothetical protein [Chryseobacterium sp. H1D6B]MDH6253579.1 hypothetical protein [Chryseobacterium sp. H1D6B]